jgi:hypothetical protein
MRHKQKQRTVRYANSQRTRLVVVSTAVRYASPVLSVTKRRSCCPFGDYRLTDIPQELPCTDWWLLILEAAYSNTRRLPKSISLSKTRRRNLNLLAFTTSRTCCFHTHTQLSHECFVKQGFTLLAASEAKQRILYFIA